MSRIGKMAITIPAGVEVEIAENNVVTVKNSKGTMTQALSPKMVIEKNGQTVTVSRPDDSHESKSLHGLTRTLLNNMIVGLDKGFTKELEVNGVGYRVQKQGNKAVMNLGYSHQVIVEETEFPPPTRSSSRVTTSRPSASSPPKSEVRDLPSPTRARASSTPVKLSAIRKARLARRSNRRCLEL